MHPKYPVRRILIRKDERVDCWIAQCVDFDLVAQAKKREDLPKAFGHVYYGQIVVALENLEPVEFRPAPEPAIVAWANITERTTESKKIPWSDFIPDWFPAAVGRLAKKVDRFAPKQEVELAVSAGASSC